MSNLFLEIDGIGHNGICFWPHSTDHLAIQLTTEENDQTWSVGLVEKTLEFWEMMPHNHPYIQVGAHDSGWYLYDPRTHDYIDMDTCGDIMFRTTSFHELFEHAFKSRLD